MNRKERKQEEKSLLFSVCLEGSKTEEDIMRAKLDYEFISNALEIREMRTMMGFGKKRQTGILAYYDTLENLVGEYIQKEYDLGIRPLKQIHVNDIRSARYNFTVSHIIKKGKQGIRHNNTLDFLAQDEDTALLLFHRKIKQLGHDLLEVTNVKKRLDGIFTEDGSYHTYGSFELIKD